MKEHLVCRTYWLSSQQPNVIEALRTNDDEYIRHNNAWGKRMSMYE